MFPTRTVLTAGLLLGLATHAAAADASKGAGATFPQPLYAKWAKAYGAGAGAGVTYAGTGSGDGVRQVVAGTVAFGGSDMPVSVDDQRKSGVMQFPSVIGGIVVVANLPGIDPGSVALDGKTLAGALSGAVAFWDDPAVAGLNPGVPLPHLAIRPVHRADASGTTYVVTDYLSKASADWKGRIGSGTTVKWPAGAEAKGSDGMVQAVAAQPGGLGYVEYSYAKKAGLPYVNLVNAEGRVVQPTPMSFAAAAASTDWADFVGTGDKSLANRPGAAAWPITTATFVVMRIADPPSQGGREPGTLEGRRVAAGMFLWALAKGGSIAEDLDYVPLPAEAAAAVRRSLAANPDLQAVASGR